MNYTLIMWSRLQVIFFLLCIYAFIHTVIGREKFQWDIGFTNVMNCHYSDYTKYDSKFKMV